MRTLWKTIGMPSYQESNMLFPVPTYTVYKRTDSPWFTREVRHLIKKRNTARRSVRIMILMQPGVVTNV